MLTFYLIRHAHADWTPDENHSLTTRGHRDAERVMEILQKYPIGAIYSSPYLRARQTVIPLAARLNLSIQIEPDLRERCLGNFMGGDFFEAVEETWQNPSFVHPGGETNTAAHARGLTTLRGLQKEHKVEHIVLSTHGNLMALIMQGFDPSIDFSFWKSLTMPDIYTLSFNQAGEAAKHRLWQE